MHKVERNKVRRFKQND